jgi:hypothetical protein
MGLLLVELVFKPPFSFTGGCLKAIAICNVVIKGCTFWMKRVLVPGITAKFRLTVPNSLIRKAKPSEYSQGK